MRLASYGSVSFLEEGVARKKNDRNRTSAVIQQRPNNDRQVFWNELTCPSSLKKGV